MSKTFVSDIHEGVGVSGPFLVDSAHKRFTKQNKTYLKLVLADRTGQIESVMWDETMEKNPASAEVRSGDFIDVSGKAVVNRYTGKVEVALNEMRLLSPADLRIEDFLPTTDRDFEQMKVELRDIIDQVDDKWIKKLLVEIFSDQALAEAFYVAPAAKNFHHAYIGGLLEHSVSVGRLALLISDHYPAIDKSLLIAGAVLHDIGKVREFDYQTRIDYSTEGRLKGHIVIGDSIVAKAMERVKGFPEGLKLQVSHLILSHQGEPEYGAAVKPKTKEAVVLNIIDNADAKVNGWLSIAKRYGENAEWTDFQQMFGDFLYLGPAGSGPPPVERAGGPAAKEDEDGTLF